MIEVEVNSIRVSLMSQQRVVLLKDINEDRYLPIWIGPPEAEAITMELHEKRQTQRPFTHDLLKSVIEHMGGRVIHIFINDMRREIFYARLVIEINEEQIEIDSRPSDAIALAVRAKAPIFVADSVMEKNGVVPEEEVNVYEEIDDSMQIGFDDVPDALGLDEDDDPFGDPEEATEEVTNDAFSAFADFVNTLDLDELDDSEDN